MTRLSSCLPYQCVMPHSCTYAEDSRTAVGQCSSHLQCPLLPGSCLGSYNHVCQQRAYARSHGSRCMSTHAWSPRHLYTWQCSKHDTQRHAQPRTYCVLELPWALWPLCGHHSSRSTQPWFSASMHSSHLPGFSHEYSRVTRGGARQHLEAATYIHTEIDAYPHTRTRDHTQAQARGHLAMRVSQWHSAGGSSHFPVSNGNIHHIHTRSHRDRIWISRILPPLHLPQSCLRMERRRLSQKCMLQQMAGDASWC